MAVVLIPTEDRRIVDRMIRAIRLFQNPAGWTPQYVDDGVHAGYAPLCWGPSNLKPHVQIASPVAL